MWERMNYYYLWMQGAGARDLYDTDRSEFYNQIHRINQLFHGIGEATMSHGEAWEFFQLGKYLERACQTARILDVKYHMLLPHAEHVGTPIDNAHWVAILKSCSGYEPFHKCAAQPSTASSVADFLIFDPALSALGALLPARAARPRLMPSRGRPLSQPRQRGRTQACMSLIDWLQLGQHRRPGPRGPARIADQGHQPHPRDRRCHPPTYFDFQIGTKDDRPCRPLGAGPFQAKRSASPDVGHACRAGLAISLDVSPVAKELAERPARQAGSSRALDNQRDYPAHEGHNIWRSGSP